MKKTIRVSLRRRRFAVAGIVLVVAWLFGVEEATCTPPLEDSYPHWIWSSIYSIAFSRDGKVLASGEGATVERETSNVTTLWNLTTRQKLRTLKSKEQGEVHAVIYSPDGKILATSDHSVRVWDSISGKELWNQFLGAPILSLAFSPDGTMLVGGGARGAILAWDVRSRAKLLFLGGHVKDVNSLAFSPDGRLLASAASDKTVRIWDVATRKEVKKLEGHGDGPMLSVRHIVRSVAWSPDGKTLASGGGDGTVRLWDVATGKQTAKLDGGTPWYSPVVWSADGKTLFSVDPKGAIREWNVSTGKEIRKLSAGEYLVSALCLSPDGKSLAAACLSKFIIWDLQSGQVRTIIERKPVAVQNKPSEEPVPVP